MRKALHGSLDVRLRLGSSHRMNMIILTVYHYNLRQCSLACVYTCTELISIASLGLKLETPRL